MLGHVGRMMARGMDAFFGRSEFAVTVPPMDGPLQPNNELDAATSLLEVPAPDNLIAIGASIYFSSGPELFSYEPTTGAARSIARFPQNITALAALDDASVAVGLASGEIALHGGPDDGRVITELGAYRGTCPTALLGSRRKLLVAQGSAVRRPHEWRRDLLETGLTGSVWELDLVERSSSCLAANLAFPNGLAWHADGDLIVSESWKHRLLKFGLDTRETTVALDQLPGYPSRLTHARDGGYWLCVFAPRNSLVEFVLKEPAYKRKMLAQVEEEYWVAPSLSSGRDFKEPLQNGAIKSMGILKPWAPTRSYGLLIRLDERLSPIRSMHSRAQGRRHGITSAVEVDDRIFVTSQGSNEILSMVAS